MKILALSAIVRILLVSVHAGPEYPSTQVFNYCDNIRNK